MTLKFNTSVSKGKSISVFIISFLVSCLLSATANAQAPKPFEAHEVIEIGNGQKIEILKCRGEGPVEECDCIYYTDKRQNGKRMWQNANRIREEQRSAELEVSAAKEQANQAAAAEAAAKAKEAAAQKAAKAKEMTASKETNEVIQTIKEQNEEIKENGKVKANELRKPTKTAQKAAAQKQAAQAALSLSEAARRIDSLNKARTKADETAVAQAETDSAIMAKVAAPEVKTSIPEIKENTTVNTEIASSPKVEEPKKIENTEAKKAEKDSIIDFETLRKLEEDNATVGGDVKIAPAEAKSAKDSAKAVKEIVPPAPPKSEEQPEPKPAKDTAKAMEEIVPPAPPTNEQESAPKPKRDENQVKEEMPKVSEETNTEAPKANEEVKPTTDSTIVSPVKEKKKKKAKKEKKVDEVTTEESTPKDENQVIEEMPKVSEETNTEAPKANEEVKPATDSIVVAPVKEKKKKKAKKEKKVEEITAEESTPTDSVSETPATDTTAAQAPVEMETPAKETPATDSASNGTTEESLKTILKDEMTGTDSKVSETKPASEPSKKKEKKAKKNKKQTEPETSTTTPAPTEPAPVPQELTPLQKAAQTADSIRKANEKTDTTAEENYRKPTDVPENKPQVTPENNSQITTESPIQILKNEGSAQTENSPIKLTEKTVGSSPLSNPNLIVAETLKTEESKSNQGKKKQD